MPPRVLVINPNSSVSCTEGIAAALRPLASPAARFNVVRLADGPPAVASWSDWFAVAEPLRRTVAREEAAAYVIACVSDPSLDAAREATSRPVLGMMRCAVAAALARGAERFGWSKRNPEPRSMREGRELVGWDGLRVAVTIEGEDFAPMEIKLDSQQGANAWLTVGIREGKNREIRRVMAYLDLGVTRLIRTAYGPFQLGALPPGAVEEVNPKVVREQLGLSAPPRPKRSAAPAAGA
mgnify:CR=1 FL=1